MKNNKSKKSVEEKSMSFEESMDRLNLLVEEMETKKLPLQTLLERYEEGIKLARACQKQLDQAEQVVRRITESPSGEIELTDIATEKGD